MDNQEIANIALTLAEVLPREFVIQEIEKIFSSQGKTYRIGLMYQSEMCQEG